MTGFSYGKFKPHHELMYKLEPYLLRDMYHFGADRLLKIVQLYLRHEIGNNELLLNMIINAIQNEKEASVDSFVNLLRNLDPAKVEERQFKIDMNRIVAIICKSLIGKLNELRPKVHLVEIMKAMRAYRIGNQAYNEILSIELARNIDKFSFEEKCDMMYSLAKTDIDANNILKTVHSVCASTLEALRIQRDMGDEQALKISDDGNMVLELPIGLYTET